MTYTAYIVDCVRTAAGKNRGALSKRHPADLGGEIINALVDRSGVPPGEIDDVIIGCVSQFGAQAGNLGRMSVLSSKLPITVQELHVIDNVDLLNKPFILLHKQL